MNPILQILHGCPQKNTCHLYYKQSKTCASGPYQYCGKYRTKQTKNSPP